MYGVGKKGKSYLLKRRGQFTLFVIIGLVIFFVFCFALYARAKIITAQLGTQVDDQLKNYLADNAIDQYVTSCLDAVTNEAIIVGSMQGGMFNSTGKINNTDYVEYYNPVLNRTFNVSIVIDTNFDCPDNRSKDQYIVSNVAGPYPYNCINTPLKDLSEKYITYGDDSCHNSCTLHDFWMYSGFFGINTLPILCDPNGPNGREIVSGANSYTCDYYADYSKSMQQLLEEKISHDINSCVNFTEILKRMPSNISNVGAVNASITFSQGSFSVNLEYPFTITMRNRQPVTKMVDFSIDKEIPFKELYEYAYELANYDVKNITFDIFNDKDKVISQSTRWAGMNNNLYSQNYIVNILPGNAYNGYTNIIQVKDITHEILGFPLTINFAIKNRRPALDYINEGLTTKYDLTTTENGTLLLAPQGYDPDDEKVLTYDYNEWQEDYTDFYNWADLACKNPTSMDYILANCTKQHPKTVPFIPLHPWTKSKSYLETAKNASYNTTHEDIGLHNVKITVRDRAGLEDFQIVKILVFDLPLARINGSNLYNDVDSNYASYEDLYILNGSESTVGVIAKAAGARFTTFLWNDTGEPFNITKDITGDLLTRTVYIPKDVDSIPPTIMNIKDRIFNGTLGARGSKQSKVHNITLTVTTDTPLSNIGKYYLNVEQCLNHSNPTIPAYPYDVLYGVRDDNLMGHLMADHSCCNDSMEYRTSQEVCYTDEEYGIDRSFQDYSAVLIKQTPTYQITYIPPPNYPNDNDIYKQTFTRKCLGDRGNICNGDITEERTVVTPGCDDYNGLTPNSPYTLAFSKERCSGPDEKYLKSDSATKIMPNPLCANYPQGKTFESIFYSGTGTCTNSQYLSFALLCSDGTTFKAYNNNLVTNFRYTCEGQCNGGECSIPMQNTCKCNIQCDPTIPSQCIGLPFTGPDSTWNNLMFPTQCDASKPYFLDICSNCMLTIKPDNICRAAENGQNLYCNAAQECNGKATLSYPIQTSCSPIGSTQKARCSNSCQLEPDPNTNTNICTTTKPTCGGDIGCNGIVKGGTSNSGTNTYCDSNCLERNCVAYIYRGGQTCPTSCTNNDQCASGYTCQGPVSSQICK